VADDLAGGPARAAGPHPREVGSVLFGHVSAFYRVLAYCPPTAPVAMPTVYAVGAASALDIVVSAAITVAATIAMTWLGGLIYQRAIMRTGERVRLRQVLGRAA
jgi:ABC-type Na+ efflux pump permease subunit